MRIPPQPIDVGLTWSATVPNLQAIALWTEKVPGKGEDAEPTFLYDTVAQRGLIATYDGMGGAGSAPARRRRDGTELSGAFIASRLARAATQNWFQAQSSRIADPASLAAGLRDELSNQLAVERERCIPSSTKISGSLRRELPTTLAAIGFQVDPNGGMVAVSMWAGDSRTHLLTPHAGMQQLTRDDTPDGDALSLLINDAPMTNVVGADRPFVINDHTLQLQVPAVLVAATDGCFGYVATPAHYELLLLRALKRATTLDEWASLLATELAGFASDDTSLALVAVGYRDFADLRQSFAPRAQQLQAEHAAPFAGASPDDHQAFASLRQASWHQYRVGYEQLLPGGPSPSREGAPAAPDSGVPHATG